MGITSVVPCLKMKHILRTTKSSLMMMIYIYIFIIQGLAGVGACPSFEGLQTSPERASGDSTHFLLGAVKQQDICQPLFHPSSHRCLNPKSSTPIQGPSFLYCASPVTALFGSTKRQSSAKMLLVRFPVRMYLPPRDVTELIPTRI